ncbi:tetratricopeptide repeat protein [Telmatospirillum sp.]|uniref:tetratricopeptide repeat protein n=1 Tax=Telmatospirillum sp. TaxID=2079197 RepID=UPI002842F23F|nr:tetratricopeptide repeat protein [Telmatospirillum sp.]MDR3440862.1 tetratricopeptide repeat protein [Telmatospirillum sp.]
MSASDKDSAGDLLIQEVDEELRREQYQKLWKRHGNVIVAAVVAVVAVVAGYQGWQEWQSRARQKEAAAFTAAEDLLTQGKTQEAADALGRLAADGRTGFVIASAMRRAELQISQGDTAAAAATYDQIAGSSASAFYRDLAVLKLALLTLDSADPAKLEGRIAPISQIANPWHSSAIEILALLSQKKGDVQHAVELYKQLADDLLAPAGIRARAVEMLAVLAPAADKAKG